jgi:hypothetical protein
MYQRVKRKSLVFPAEQLRQKNKMPGGRYGKKFRYSLNDPKRGGLQYIHKFRFVESFCEKKYSTRIDKSKRMG